MMVVSGVGRMGRRLPLAVGDMKRSVIFGGTNV